MLMDANGGLCLALGCHGLDSILCWDILLLLMGLGRFDPVCPAAYHMVTATDVMPGLSSSGEYASEYCFTG